jgi:hypothetical protein
MREPDRGYETRDFRPGLVIGIGAGLAGLILAALVGMRGLLGLLVRDDARRRPEPISLAAGESTQVPPAPRLEPNPARSLEQVRAAEEAILNGYGWVDEAAGVVHIPIERAIRLTVERGLPVAGPAAEVADSTPPSSPQAAPRRTRR